MKDWDFFKLIFSVLPIVISILTIYFTYKRLRYDFAKDKLEKIDELTNSYHKLKLEKKCYQQTFLETIDFFIGYNLETAYWVIQKDFNIFLIRQIGRLLRNNLALVHEDKLIMPNFLYAFSKQWEGLVFAFLTITFASMFIILVAVKTIDLQSYIAILMFVLLMELITLVKLSPLLDYRVIRKKNFVIMNHRKEFKSKLKIWRENF